jgi:hypothetical protein
MNRIKFIIYVLSTVEYVDIKSNGGMSDKNNILQIRLLLFLLISIGFCWKLWFFVTHELRPVIMFDVPIAIMYNLRVFNKLEVLSLIFLWCITYLY